MSFCKKFYPWVCLCNHFFDYHQCNYSDLSPNCIHLCNYLRFDNYVFVDNFYLVFGNYLSYGLFIYHDFVLLRFLESVVGLLLIIINFGFLDPLQHKQHHF